MIVDVGDTCTFGGFTLGQTDNLGVEAYFVALDGWGAPQSTAQAVQKAASDGAFATPAYFQARAFTITGALVAASRPALVAAFDRMQAAATINPQNVIIVNGGAYRYCIAQRQGEIAVTDETDVYIEFTIQFLAVDPRKFGTSVVTSTLLPASSGGLAVPFTVPFTIASTVQTGSCSAMNVGSLNGPVTMRVDGPVTGPQITHITTGLELVLANTYNLPAGSWLTINMDAHTALENDIADRASFIVTRGFSPFVPGSNTWAFSASTGSTAARLTVTASPAWP
jgi:hypothetical protein